MTREFSAADSTHASAPAYYDVIVCGAGPAGLSAALSATESGARVLLLEKNPRPGVKLLASGGTRCNFSNILPEKEFMESFGRNGRFMTEALRAAPRESFLSFFKREHLMPELSDGFHYFPASGKASDVLNVFLNAAERSGRFTLRCSCRLKTIEALEKTHGESDSVPSPRLCSVEENGRSAKARFLLRSDTDDLFLCSKLVLACGGTAMSRLGASNSGLELAKSLGHSIVKPLPAMSPLCLQEEWPKQLSGVSLPDAELAFSRSRTKHSSRGELLFTFDGISGPAAINLSAEAHQAFYEDGTLTLSLNLCPSFTPEDWTHCFDSWRRNSPRKQLRSIFGTLVPNSLGIVLADLMGVSDQTAGRLNKALEHAIIRQFTGLPLHLAKFCPMDKAMAMKGGVSLKEINPKTLESRCCQGLFFAGEMMDLVGPCGGFNIQFALSSGHLAGQWTSVADGIPDGTSP